MADPDIQLGGGGGGVRGGGHEIKELDAKGTVGSFGRRKLIYNKITRKISAYEHGQSIPEQNR